MMCCSIFQPFATLMALGLKKNETRTWGVNYRGPMCIAATVTGRSLVYVDRNLMLPIFQEALRPHVVRPEGQNEVRATDLVYGKILAMVDIVGCVPADVALRMGITDMEKAFGDYAPGRFVYLTANLRRFETPIPVKGSQRFYRIRDVNTETSVIHELQKLREKVAA